MKKVGLTPTEIDALFAMFKERESKDKLTGKCLSVSPLKWTLDPGVSHHITSNFQALINLEKFPEVINITTPTSYIVAVRETGTVDLGA